MVKFAFLQLGGEEEAYDIMMQIGEWGQGFSEKLSEFATSIFGAFGF